MEESKDYLHNYSPANVLMNDADYQDIPGPEEGLSMAQG